MNLALIQPQRFFANLCTQLKRTFLPKTASGTLPEKTQYNTDFVPVLAATHAILTRAHSPSEKPLRVLRVVEAGQHASHVGRMVISGRMADVCAELDRLAAREAALT